MESYFETIKCFEKDIYNIKYHNKRVSDTIGLNLNLQEYIYPPNKNLLRVKIIYDKNGIIDVKYYNYNLKEYNIFKLIVSDDINYSKKYLNRFHIEQLHSKKGIADEIIIVKDGFVTDTSIANIAIFKNNSWFTPKSPLLFGTTRERLLEEGFLKEGDIRVEDIKKAKKIAIMNAMIGFKIIKEKNIIY